MAARATRTGDYPASRSTAFKLRTRTRTSELSTLLGNQRTGQVEIEPAAAVKGTEIRAARPFVLHILLTAGS